VTIVATPSVEGQPCAACGTQVAPGLLACPGCHRLVHAGTLNAHAARAEASARAGDLRAALEAWRASLDLLPAGSKQHEWVTERVAALALQVDSTAAAAEPLPTTGRWKWLMALGPAALLVWKLKFVVVALLSKGKLLLLGLTKMSTLASMFAAVGVYWTLWGFWFALGLVLAIYVHEMGHVAALRRYGIAASAPMFIPGVGALVRMKQAPVSGREDARIGLAGPLWGLGASVAAWIVASAGGGPMWAAIAVTSAWLNLFNLMPIWQLDGGRAFAPLSHAQCWIATAALAAAWLVTRDGVVLLVLIVAAARSARAGRSEQQDRGALALYAFVAIGLAMVFRLAHAGPAPGL
jgi:Zn-dependent protease